MQHILQMLWGAAARGAVAVANWPETWARNRHNLFYKPKHERETRGSFMFQEFDTYRELVSGSGFFSKIPNRELVRIFQREVRKLESSISVSHVKIP